MKIGIHGLISISAAASGGIRKFMSSVAELVWKNTKVLQHRPVSIRLSEEYSSPYLFSIGTTSESIVIKTALTTVLEPPKTPWSAESQTRRMSNACQNQPRQC